MDNFDPIKAVHQLRAWIKQKVSAANASSLAEARTRYRKITKVIDQLQGLDISVPKDIMSEKRAIEEFIAASGETRLLTSLANELSTLAREIDRHLKSLESKQTRARHQRLRVKFPDGKEIFENKAVDTFVKTIECVGLERVSELHFVRRHGHPIVSRERNESARNVRELDGYYIETHSSTEEKRRFIQDIARALHFEISVDCMDS